MGCEVSGSLATSCRAQEAYDTDALYEHVRLPEHDD